MMGDQVLTQTGAPAPMSQAGCGRQRAMIILAFLIVIGFILYCFGLTFYPINPNMSKEFIGMVFGALSTLAGVVLNYFFGSSSGSASKDETIKSLTKPA